MFYCVVETYAKGHAPSRRLIRVASKMPVAPGRHLPVAREAIAEAGIIT
jgi:hypothetical protein